MGSCSHIRLERLILDRSRKLVGLQSPAACATRVGGDSDPNFDNYDLFHAQSPDTAALASVPYGIVLVRVRVRGLGVEEVVILKARIRVATHTCGTGGGRLQADELAAAIQDESLQAEMAA